MANGRETIEQIRHDARLAQLPVFVVTGMRESEVSAEIQPSWNGWFLKPVNVDHLIEFICLETE